MKHTRSNDHHNARLGESPQQNPGWRDRNPNGSRFSHMTLLTAFNYMHEESQELDANNAAELTSSRKACASMRPSIRARRSLLAGPPATFRLPSCQYAARRQRSTEASTAQEPATASLSPRWLSDVKQRLGKCITFGLRPDQTQEAGHILQEIARDWRELVAGSEGFLTSPHRRGLFRRRVVWGEQDAMVCTLHHCLP